MTASPNPAAELSRIREAVQRGDLAMARSIADQARLSHPGDAGLADALGNLAMKTGDFSAALDHFAAASSLAPSVIEYSINHAIALQRLGRHGEALATLGAHEMQGQAIARYASVRALSHRELGQMTEAAQWFDAVLKLEPNHPRALHGRARVALQRGEPGALQRFDAALAVNPGDADLWLGKAQALDVMGDAKGARLIAQQLCDQAPGFIPVLEFLAGLNLAVGDKEFAAPFAAAKAKAPQDPNIAVGHVEVLAGVDHFSKAAEIAAEARERFPTLSHFALLEAVHAGSAGEWDRADAIFASLPEEMPQRALHEARHRIRSGEIVRACALLETALKQSPWDIAAWAVAGIAWRISDDERYRARAAWLHERAGLIQFRPLAARKGLIEDVTAELRRLHQGSVLPLGQSLRGGTQTRGILFHRTEPLLAELHDAIRATLKEYRADLPPPDETHPMLRHRNAPWQLAGSWSVRLTGAGDYHAPHIHYQGLISSALYLVVPEEVDESGHPGCLEIGRPKADLRADLSPLKTIQPMSGYMALFPSTAYHGTRPFRAAERMTVAFDVVPGVQDWNR